MRKTENKNALGHISFYLIVFKYKLEERGNIIWFAHWELIGTLEKMKGIKSLEGNAMLQKNVGFIYIQISNLCALLFWLCSNLKLSEIRPVLCDLRRQ